MNISKCVHYKLLATNIYSKPTSYHLQILHQLIYQYALLMYRTATKTKFVEIEKQKS